MSEHEQMDRLARRTCALVGVIAVVGALLLGWPAMSATPEEEAAALTGINTAESERLDRESEELLARSKKLQTEADAIPAQPRSKIDYKLMLERLKKGDRSALFETTPEQEQARQRAAQIAVQVGALRDQAYAKRRDAADKRAQAALEQRCVVPAATATPARGAATSTNLCGAVQAGRVEGEANNPWTVCSCALQYLRGVNNEILALQERAKELVGKQVFGDVNCVWRHPGWSGPTGGCGPSHQITSADIDKAFRTNEPLDALAVIDTPFRGFKWAAQETQRALASAAAQRGELINHQPPLAMLQSAKREAYFQIQNFVGRAWELHKKQAFFTLSILQKTIIDRKQEAWDKFHKEAIELSHRAASDGGPWLSGDPKWGPAEENLCSSSDAIAERVVNDAVTQARAIAAELKATRERLVREMEIWKLFGAKDGAGGDPDGGHANYRDIDFAEFIVSTFVREPKTNDELTRNFPAGVTALEISIPEFHEPLRSQLLSSYTPKCIPFAHFLPDPTAGWPPPDPVAPVYDDSGRIQEYHVPKGTKHYPSEDEIRALFDAHFKRLLAALQQRYPETTSVGAQIGFRFSLDADEKKIVRAIASGTEKVAQGGRFPEECP
jgi:hypothetical protein